MTQKQRPTLLEWLKSKTLAELEIIAGFDNKDIALHFYTDLHNYGIQAFNVFINADKQYDILNQYVWIYRD